MSEAKFTKGDWRVERFVNGNGFEIAFNEDGEVIADYVYTEPDAHLIAAAPKMYKDIEADIEWLERLAKRYAIGSYELRSIHSRIEVKRNLLAEARGEL
ncbi:MAG: hypothetical protein ABJG42_24655 [Vibrio splendidus]